MKKRTVLAVIILIVIVAAVVFALNFQNTRNDEVVDDAVVNENVKELPSLAAYCGDEQIAVMEGYVADMNICRMRDAIIPVESDGSVTVKVYTNDNEITSLSYDVRSCGDESLVDSGDVSSFDEDGENITFNYDVSAVMEYATEYYLTFHLSTKECENINYYTRVMVMEKDFVQKQIAFAKKFSSAEFDADKASMLVQYMEPSGEDDDNFGRINLESSYSMLTWGDMSPKRIGGVSVTSKEFCIKDTGEAGTYTLNYKISAVNAEKVTETYNVSETITVWTFNKKQYVLGYERAVNQIWEANEYNIGNSFIDLGIQDTTQADYVESKDGSYIAYTINSDVYVMDLSQKIVKCVYKKDEEDENQLTKLRSKVVGVDKKGNVNYLLYGYSPTTKHLGKSGISVLSYDYERNSSAEVVFVPCDIPAEVIDTQFSNVCYLGDGALYIMLDNAVYYANLNTKEWGVLADGLEDGEYAVSEDGSVLAYNEGGGEYSDTITVVNFSNGQKESIKSDKKKSVAVCGYTGSNLIYGEGKVKNQFKMDTLKILDENLSEVREYGQKGVCITDIEITDTIITIKREKNGKAIEDDQLIDNTKEEVVLAVSGYYNDDMKKKELAISYTTDLNSSMELQIEDMGDISFYSESEVSQEFMASDTGKYYVYGYGGLKSVFESKKAARQAARDVCGRVVDEAGNSIWIYEEHYND